MIKYSDIAPHKSAFIFELDNVIYPEKDYLFQVYYLFASFLEYTELLDAKAVVDFMVTTYQTEGKGLVFDQLKEKFAIDEKYRINFQHLLLTVKLPLKLLIYQTQLALLQDIVADRKKIFIVTNGSPVLQLNKIKQTEWHGLETYLICYFAEETAAMPEPDVLHLLMKEHNLERKDLLMIGNSEAGALCAEACGIDYKNVDSFL